MGINLNEILCFDRSRNCWNWSLEADGTFSVRSLRKEVDSHILEAHPRKMTWCKEVPRKINLFVWRLLRDKLPTRDNLSTRGVAFNSNLCPACNCFPETADHLFLRCSTTKMLRARLSTWWPKLPNPDRCRDVQSLLQGASDTRLPVMDKLKVEVILRAFIWVVWCSRNNMLFRGKIPYIPNLEYEVKNTSYLWVKVRSKFGRNWNKEEWM